MNITSSEAHFTLLTPIVALTVTRDQITLYDDGVTAERERQRCQSQDLMTGL